MSYYKQQMRNLLSRRAGDWLLHRAWPRTFAAFAISVPLLFAFSCFNQLFALGMHNVALRVPFCILSAYSGYLCVMSLWLLKSEPLEARSLLVDGTNIRTQMPGNTEFDKSLDDAVDFQLEQSNCRGETLEMMFALAMLGYIFVALHFVYHAPWYLGQLLVDSGRIRHRSVQANSQLNWFLPTVRQSWVVAVVLVVHYTFVAIAISTMKFSS